MPAWLRSRLPNGGRLGEALRRAATPFGSSAEPVPALQPGGPPISLPDDLAQSYAGTARLLKARWSDPPLPAAAAVGALAELAAARHGLAGLLPAALEALPDRRAFWINVYNGAVVDRVLAAGVRRSVKEQRRFFRRRQLRVADVTLSLDDMEHGFLRGNPRHPARLLTPLWRRPRLRRWVIDPVDPRIHFALACGRFQGQRQVRGVDAAEGRAHAHLTRAWIGPGHVRPRQLSRAGVDDGSHGGSSPCRDAEPDAAPNCSSEASTSVACKLPWTPWSASRSTAPIRSTLSRWAASRNVMRPCW